MLELALFSKVDPGKKSHKIVLTFTFTVLSATPLPPRNSSQFLIHPVLTAISGTHVGVICTRQFILFLENQKFDLLARATNNQVGLRHIYACYVCDQFSYLYLTETAFSAMLAPSCLLASLNPNCANSPTLPKSISRRYLELFI